MSGFEGSFLGDAARVGVDAILECGVCWWVYDPARGDEVWQVAPGTPFTALPSHWRCPNCDAAPEQFMLLGEGSGAGPDRHKRPAPEAGLEALARHSRQIEKAYVAVDQRMRELPVYNDRLGVLVTGMRRCAEGLLCVVATPWCMNLVLLAMDGGARREGTSREIAFPSGRYPFTAGYLEGVGALESCSLFSPMDAFDDPDVVAEVAAQVMHGLFEPDAETAADATGGPSAGLSRRQFLRSASRA